LTTIFTQIKIEVALAALAIDIDIETDHLKELLCFWYSCSTGFFYWYLPTFVQYCCCTLLRVSQLLMFFNGLLSFMHQADSLRHYNYSLL